MKPAEQHRRNAPSFDKPLPPAMPLTSLHIPTTSVASPNDSDLMLTATSFTPSSAGLLTPLSYSSFDYFGNGAAAAGASKREGPRVHRQSHQSPTGRVSQNSTRHRHHPSSSLEDASSHEHSHKRPKTRERREKDKKEMLSKALEKANTAVLLDNAMNYEGALDAYQDACRLLEFVMGRTSGPDDKRKLEAIRETYAIRIEELLQLLHTTQPVSEEKSLPPRPMSNDSLELSPTMGMDTTAIGDRDSAVIETATMTRMVDAPRHPSYMPRHSFLTDAIREVEGSSSEAFLGPLWEKSKSPFRESNFSDRTALEDDNLKHTYMPRPLTPRRSPSHDSRENLTGDADSVILPAVELPGDMPGQPINESSDTVSWLDTIDESGSDASSVRSHSSRQELQRRDISGSLGEPELDFDTAFDAAVEAAYEDGYMPDTETARLGTTEESTGERFELEAPGPIQGFDFPSDSEHDLDEDAEEERMLDDIARDYADHGFNFDMQSKSALPRQSDSSLLSRNTWQSSVVSNRTTAGTSLSAAERSLAQDFKSEESPTGHSTVDTSHNALLPDIVFGSSARPLSVISEGSRSVQDRRSTGPNFKQLKIETATKPLQQWSRTPLPAVNDETPNDEKENRPISEVPSLHHFEKKVISPPADIMSAGSDMAEGYQMDSSAPPSSAGTINSLKSPRPRLFRKNKSTMSLRDHSMLISEENEQLPITPLSATFMQDGPPTARRPYITPSAGSYPAFREGSYSVAQMFDTSIGAASSQPSSPQSENASLPQSLEPCPESALLRPFWLLRNISSTIVHPRGAFLTTRLFVPREVWQTRSVKLKYLDDKIANCDLLTAALGKLAKVDTYDADAVLEELQAFEEVMERVQAVMVKRLGSEVGVQGISALFKDATTTEGGAVISEGRDGPKTNSGKSYLSSWRKLRSKNSGFGGGASGNAFTTGVRAEKEGTTMASVPMTSFVSVEKRTAYKRDPLQDPGLEGPLKEYTSSLARLCEAAQVLGESTPLLNR